MRNDCTNTLILFLVNSDLEFFAVSIIIVCHRKCMGKCVSQLLEVLLGHTV